MLRIDTSTLRIGRRTLAEPMRCHVPQKEIHLLEGPNGCGKSLLLDALTGVRRLRGVKASIDGRGFLRGTPYARWRAGVRRLFQTPNLPGQLTVRQVLDRLVPAHVVNGAWLDQSNDFLSASGIRFTEPLGSHSFRQQRSVELVSALATGSCCLLDEPFAGLGPVQVAQAMQLMRDAAAEGKSILVTDNRHAEHSEFYSHVYPWRVPEKNISERPDAFPSLNYSGPRQEDRQPFAVRWLVRRFDVEGRAILKDFEIELRPGRLLALTGGNGAVSSKLLLELGKFVQPRAGVDSDMEIKQEGAPVKMFLSPQPPKLAGDLSVKENLRLMMRGGDPGNGAELESAARMLRWLGVSQLKARAGVLSSGEAGIVALVGALLSPAEVLLLDEPFESFSSETTRRCLALIDAALKQGKAIIAATHDAQLIGSVDSRQLVDLKE
jgi:ABC-type multidrug transport system ATPase subunit